jgi:hypothetical protein
VLAVIVAATLTCVGALSVGQATCWLCGARSWTFLAVPVGFALLMLVSVVAIHLPGRATTIAVVLAVLVLASLVLLARAPEQRPRLGDLLCAGPAGLLVLLPFIANGRAGTLGVSIDNDMHAHLLWAEAIRSSSVASVTNINASYPVGPHALAAALAQILGVRVDYVFAGEIMALPVLLAWTSLVALRRVGWPGKAFVATLTALTFMVAGYYAEGSFKEVIQAMLVLGFALGLGELIPGDRQRGVLRWAPLAVIAGGSLSVYTVAGLPWLVAILGLWLATLAVRRMWRGGWLATVYADLRGAVWPAAVSLGVLLVLIVPQLPRLVKYYEENSGGGISTSTLGNLVGPVSFWKVFGMWDVADFRMPAAEPFHVGVFAGFGLLAAVGGTIWWSRRDHLAIPLAAVAALAIWIYSNEDQSPYVAAKALVILSPLVMLLATRWLVELRAGESWISGTGVLRVLVAGLLGWAVLGTSIEALRNAEVGPTAHIDDLRALRPLLGRSPTLFLGWDNFIKWELAGTPVDQPFAEEENAPVVELRPQKGWTPGQALEFDDITAATFDRYRYVVGPRDPAGSRPPANMELVRTTAYYDVWERRGRTPEPQTLAKGPEPGAMLDCSTAQGRALARTGGEAAVRRPNVIVPVPAPLNGQTVTVQIRLTRGVWWLSSPYTSPHPIEVRTPGLRTVLPANLDRPGSRWPVGRIAVTGSAPTTVSFHVQRPWLAAPSPSPINELVATPQTPTRVVPLSRACGSYVEWYETRPST